MKPATTDGSSHIRPARASDLRAVVDLLQRNRLPEAALAQYLPDLLVAVDGRRVVGSAALERHGEAALLRSVAVEESQRGRGLGVALTRAALDRARERGMRAVYLLTETAADFFARAGFRRIPRAEAEPAVGASVEFTTACPTSATCMVLLLDAAPSAPAQGEEGG